MKSKKIVPFAPVLVESTRSMGYSFETALADIIDNSISANATEIHVDFMSINEPWVSIVDNGNGMDQEELESAMRYGSRNSLDRRAENDLGRFGLGMKTASLSQCRKLIVVSKKDNEINSACWDIDYILEVQDWFVKILSKEEILKIPGVEYLESLESGTVVYWQVFDRMLQGAVNPQKVFDEKINVANDHIALVFHRFLNEENIRNRIRILFNGDAVIPKDPFLSSHPATQPLTEQTLRIKGEEIKVKPYVLPYTSKLSAKEIKNIGGKEDLRQKQGFYVYRNKRLIIWGTWFRLLKQYELNKLARVRVDIPNSLDSIWNIDIKKSKAELPEVIKRNLVAIVENAVGKSERVYKYRGRLVKQDEYIHAWNKIDNRGKIEYLINREMDLYRILLNHVDKEGEAVLELFLKILESSFPFSSVYYDMAKNEADILQNEASDQEIYDMVCQMLGRVKSIDGNVDLFINNLDRMDTFVKYPHVIKKIREEYSDD